MWRSGALVVGGVVGGVWGVVVGGVVGGVWGVVVCVCYRLSGSILLAPFSRPTVFPCVVFHGSWGRVYRVTRRLVWLERMGWGENSVPGLSASYCYVAPTVT